MANDDRLVALESHGAAMHQRLEAVQDALGHMHQQMQLLLINRADDDQRADAMRDTVWACENCAARLGIYDAKADQLRVRYKDFVCYVTPGVGGTVRVPCRRCGLENELLDTREAAQVAGHG
jgi:hypothetical protein